MPDVQFNEHGRMRHGVRSRTYVPLPLSSDNDFSLSQHSKRFSQCRKAYTKSLGQVAFRIEPVPGPMRSSDKLDNVVGNLMGQSSTF